MTVVVPRESPNTAAKNHLTTAKATFWITLTLIWCVHMFTSTSSSVDDWLLLPWFLTPYIGGVTLATAIWLKSWWRIAIALVLGVGSPWVLTFLHSHSTELGLFLPL